MKLNKSKLTAFLLGLLVLISLFVRLYRLSYTQTFLEDEGRDLLIVKRMVDTGKPVLLGPQTSIGSMYLGPFYYYFIAPALIASSMDPIGPAILIALTGAFTVFLIFQLSSKWYGNRAGFLAAMFYALMPLPVAFTRNSWNPDLVPLVSVIIIWLVDRLRTVEKKDLKLFVAIGFLTGILVQLHYMALIFIGIYALLLLFWWGKSGHFFKALALTLVGFTVAMAPFFLFEIRNDWVNSQAIISFIKAEESPNIRYSLPLSLWWSKVKLVSFTVIGGLFSRGSYRPFDSLTPVITLITLLVTAIGITTSKIDNKRKAILALSIFGSLAILGIYQENIHVHYLGFLFTVSYLGFTSIINSRYWVLSLVGVIIGVALLSYSLPVMLGNISNGESRQVLKAREVSRYIVEKSGGKPYNLVSSSKTSKTPYQYFAFLSQNPPSNIMVETTFLVCQDEPCSESEINNKQLFLTGASHPSLDNYVGHPFLLEIPGTPHLISNEHVSSGVWVAELQFPQGQ